MNPKKIFLHFILGMILLSCTSSKQIVQRKQFHGAIEARNEVHKKQTQGSRIDNQQNELSRLFGQVGPIDFNESIPKFMELMGLGFLWIRAIGVATGVPFVYPILLPCLIIIAVTILFIPNQQINFNNFVG